MSKMIVNLTPAPGYILINPLQGEKKTASGIVLPDSHEEKPQKGRVVAVGPVLVTDYGTKLSPPCKKEDMVVFKKWSGNEYRPEGSNQDYLLVKFDDIMAIVK